MNELDFDELDKAVNSLMGGMSTDKRNTALDDPEDKVISLDTPASSNSIESAAPASATPVSTPSPADSESNTTSPSPLVARPAQPLAVKRRGQFMDMVHPSSDMKTVSSSPRREGVSVQPASPFVPPALSQLGANDAGTELKPQPTAPVLDVVTPANTASPEFPEASKTEDTPQKSEWPDPIDLATQSTDTDSARSSESEVPREVIQEVASPAQDEPLSSPFLPDAKVEKRPLGGAGNTDSPTDSDAAIAAEPAVTPNSDLPAAQLPDELRTDVMALESTSTITPSAGQDAVGEPSVSAAPMNEVSSSDAVKKDVAQTGSGSIPQQYSEAPTTVNQTNTPIYDTSTHQPLNNGLKKSSPAKWIILMLVLLIIGAIAGAAYFYFTTR